MTKKRNLRIKRRPNKNVGGVDVAAIEKLIELRVKPLEDRIQILRYNSDRAGVILRDIFSSAELAHTMGGSSKAVLEEFFTHLSAAGENLKEYLDVGLEEAEQKVDLNVFSGYTAAEEEIRDPRFAADLVTETLRREQSGGEVPQDEGDEIIEDVSEEEDDSWAS